MNDYQIAIGVTFYQPQKEEIEYINCLYYHFSNVYIYDNSDVPIEKEIQNKNVTYFFNGKNDGLSIAFNCFLQQSYKDHMDYLLLLDQDSLFDINQILGLKNELQRKPYDESVGIYACKAYPSNVKMEDLNYSNEDTVEEKMVISSGSFINLKSIFKKVKYDENLFVDYVDADFCRQLHEKKLKIMCYNKYPMEQSLGYLYHGYICHSAIRHYYMVRDLGYMNQKYYTKSVTVLKTLKFYFLNLLVIGREDKKMKKIIYSSKGLVHYFRNIKGECTL